MRHRLIGITGAAGSGKNTVADMIPGAHVIQLADPLYAMLSEMLGIDIDVLRLRSTKEHVIPWIGKSPRQLLQTLGTEWGRGCVRDDLWIRLLDRRLVSMRSRTVVAVADVRFDNEADYIREVGGEVWHIRRHGVVGGTHVSESGVTVKPGDVVISNDSTIDALRSAVMDAWQEAVCQH